VRLPTHREHNCLMLLLQVQLPIEGIVVIALVGAVVVLVAEVVVLVGADV
jgi:hypothetical protein